MSSSILFQGKPGIFICKYNNSTTLIIEMVGPTVSINSNGGDPFVDNVTIYSPDQAHTVIQSSVTKITVSPTTAQCELALATLRGEAKLAVILADLVRETYLREAEGDCTLNDTFTHIEKELEALLDEAMTDLDFDLADRLRDLRNLVKAKIR